MSSPYEREINEYVRSIDSVSRVKKVSVSVGESVSISGANVSTKKRANRHTPIQLFMVNGVLTHLAIISRKVDGNTTINSSVSRVRTVPRTLNGMLTMSDISESLVVRVRTVGDAITVEISQITRLLKSNRIVSNMIDVSTGLDLLRRVNRTVLDVVNISDNTDRIRQIPRLIYESLNISTESVASARKTMRRTLLTMTHTAQSLTESFSISSNVSRMLHSNRAVNESFSIVDAVPFAGIIHRYTREVVEALTVSDNTARLRTVPRMFIESIAMLAERFTKHCRAEED